MPYFGALLLVRIDDAEATRVLLRQLTPYVKSSAGWQDQDPVGDAWINVFFTFEGLRRIGVDESILAGFPVEFRQGMAARKEYLGDVGKNDPEQWDVPHGATGLHIGFYIMAGSVALRDEKIAIGHQALDGLDGVTLIHRLDVGVPPTLRDHFGFADGISRPRGRAPRRGLCRG
jgi:hypothetical protein